MEKQHVQLNFSQDFVGTLQTQLGEFSVGRQKGDLLPYDMVLGALGSCYYATFLGIAEKMRLEYEKVEIDIRGAKRQEVPTTLEWVEVKLDFYGVAPKQDNKFARAVDLAGQYCSVHEMIAQVAKITTTYELHPQA